MSSEEERLVREAISGNQAAFSRLYGEHFDKVYRYVYFRVSVRSEAEDITQEVFLKALSVVRNLGRPVRNFTTANFDFLQHYRPRVNVVERPHTGAGGQGFAITGHHEIMIPLLAAALLESGT